MKPVSDSNLPPGIILLPDFIFEEYENRLIECVKWEESDTEKEVGERDQQSLKHRRVRHYGYEFIYGVNNVDPQKPLPQGIPSECDDVLDRILELGYVKKRPDQLTVNQYEPGQGKGSYIRFSFVPKHFLNEEPARFIHYVALAIIILNSPFSKVVFS
jgi:alkylated DNA repair protein alkB family protein 8